jgi:hypothetical protein
LDKFGAMRTDLIVQRAGARIVDTLDDPGDSSSGFDNYHGIGENDASEVRLHRIKPNAYDSRRELTARTQPGPTAIVASELQTSFAI